MGATTHGQAGPHGLGSVSRSHEANQLLTGRATGRTMRRFSGHMADHLKARSIRWARVGGQLGRDCLERRAASRRADEGAVVMQREQRQARGGESCLNCPRCGPTISLRAPWLAIRFSRTYGSLRSGRSLSDAGSFLSRGGAGLGRHGHATEQARAFTGATPWRPDQHLRSAHTLERRS